MISASRVSLAERLLKSREMAAIRASCSANSSSRRDFSHWMRCSALGMGLARKASRWRWKTVSSWLICCWVCCR
ncbi:hypothetical protein D3C87_2057390 [compost metagenome]